jgi:precorrin-6x reductase
VKVWEESNVKRVLVFAGTTEGHLVIDALTKMRVDIYVSVATEYGRISFEYIPKVKVISGRMDAEAIRRFIIGKEIDIVIDATHPFAQAATANIKKACEGLSTELIRCLRESAEKDIDLQETQVVSVMSVKEAVDYLRKTKGNIFIATGSKELAAYTKLEGYRERCYARVLPIWGALEESMRLGFQGRNLIAMQGPFSKELNIAMLRHVKASYFVTKESGKAGGFREKLQAAQETQTVLVVIERPDEQGMSVEEVIRRVRQNV